jgi:hypothetical protein
MATTIECCECHRSAVVTATDFPHDEWIRDVGTNGVYSYACRECVERYRARHADPDDAITLEYGQGVD